MASEFDRRALLSALAVPALAATVSAAALPGSDDLSGEIHVGPAPNSDLDWDSREVVEIRNLLAPLSNGVPASADEVESLLRARYPGKVTSSEIFDADWRWIIFMGEWKHICFSQTNFTVNFGRSKTALVQVIEKKLRD
jgi:hypothetical protein